MSTFTRARSALYDRLHEAIGLDAALDEARFDALALDLFAHQFEHIPAYARLCRERGRTSDSCANHRDIPAVPTSVFRQLPLHCCPADEIARTFCTSGTTGGEAARGRSHFSRAGLDLMERAILVNAGRMLFPDVERIHILVLAPSPDVAPHMIMAWGMARLIERFGTDLSGFLIDEQGLDMPLLMQRLTTFGETGEPVTLIGASFGFVNLLEGMASKGISFRLPSGSRTMDAGGYKGRSRELTRSELEQGLADVLGIAPDRAVNLLGMTEMASQIYDDTLAASVAGTAPRRLKTNPPWTRTRVVDPLTLDEVPPGEEGVLLHMDLANLDTPMAVLTDDVGVGHEGGFEILGRLTSEGSRGCSLTVDELSGGRA